MDMTTSTYNAYNEMLHGVAWVLKNRTSYRIGKDLNIAPRMSSRYKSGETPIENMTLQTAKMFYEYYLKEAGNENE